ncbi:MAG: diphosphomevalonate decarboxylase [Legionellales bacterium]|nr:diphosphomevalonate decarboxylase [Legionellales bacterium]
MSWFAQAPSNIALIKYMGKKNVELNLPINPSISYTLTNLLTSVMIEEHPGKKDFWEPLDIPGALPVTLPKEAEERFLSHLARLKALFNHTGAMLVRSSNNFPHSSGLASSASSFAALTKCAIMALSELTKTPPPSTEIMAQLSRIGSGSSCRSFFAPWALWEDETVTVPEIPYKKLLHQVIIISRDEKKVSSREAHLRVMTSPNYPTRNLRAQQNLKALLHALKSEDWKSAYHISWQEFQDLHSLFSTSAEPFSYMTSQSQELLTHLQNVWKNEGDGPIITMDAGPNIHVLYRPDQADMARRFKQDHLIGNYDVF